MRDDDCQSHELAESKHTAGTVNVSEWLRQLHSCNIQKTVETDSPLAIKSCAVQAIRAVMLYCPCRSVLFMYFLCELSAQLWADECAVELVQHDRWESCMAPVINCHR